MHIRGSLLIALSLAVTGPAAYADNQLIGKWREPGKPLAEAETLEFFKDGKTVSVRSKGVNLGGDYSILDARRVRMDLGGLGTLAGPMILEYSVAQDVLTLTDSDGKATEYRRVQEAHSRVPTGAGTPAKDDRLGIDTPTGRILVRDPRHGAEMTTPSGDVLVRRTGDYDLVYFSRDRHFLITISSVPVESARRKAETALLAALEVSESDACRLHVSIRVPHDVDPRLAGKSLPLTFCSPDVSGEK